MHPEDNQQISTPQRPARRSNPQLSHHHHPSHRHAYVVDAPTETVVVVAKENGGPKPASAVLTTREHPLQLTVTVVVVKVEYVVEVLPADFSGWITSVVGHAAAAW